MTLLKQKQIGWNIRRVTGDATAKPGDMMLVDATAANVTITAPAAPVDGHSFMVKKVDTTNNFVLAINNAGQQIESKIGKTLGTTGFLLFFENECVEFSYESTPTPAWYVSATAALQAWFELYQATPVADIPTTPTTVQWTHVPLFTGQTPELVSLAAGVFTTQFATDFDTEISLLWTFDISANNQDAHGRLDNTFTPAGTGDMIFVPIENAFTSPRTGLFNTSNSTTGAVNAQLGVAGDQFSFVANSLVGQSGATDIAEAILVLRAG
jgi:hypothetical protein